MCGTTRPETRQSPHTKGTKVKARAHPVQIGEAYDAKVWREADTKEELYQDIIWFEQSAAWLASRMYKALLRDERDIDEIHDEQIARNMGDPNCVPFILYYEDGTTEPMDINLSASTIRRELGL